MKTLIYVPVIHTSADLGSIAKDVTKRGIASLGEKFWEEHIKTVDGFWDTISRHFDSIAVCDMKIYQDGMVVEGEAGEEIVREIAKAGSKNHEIILRLLKRGARLVKTEEFKLVKMERDVLLAITQAKSILRKLIAFAKYEFTKNSRLEKRDKYIIERINKTLEHGETGILFIGAYHNIKDELPKSFRIIEIKNTEKVREYQRLLPFHNRYKKKFKELSEYLVSETN